MQVKTITQIIDKISSYIAVAYELGHYYGTYSTNGKNYNVVVMEVCRDKSLNFGSDGKVESSVMYKIMNKFKDQYKEKHPIIRVDVQKSCVVFCLLFEAGL